MTSSFEKFLDKSPISGKVKSYDSIEKDT